MRIASLDISFVGYKHCRAAGLQRNALLASNLASCQELTEALKSERAAQRFGPATTRLVTLFRGEQDLLASGALDESTAHSLNHLIQEWGLLDEVPLAGRVATEQSGQSAAPDGATN